MTKYSLRTRVITLTLAPTLIIGLLLSAFFTTNRYHDLESQLIATGTSIIEPLAISSEHYMQSGNRESVRRLISYAHRKHSKFIRSIAVFDTKHKLFVTSNFHPNFESLTFPKNEAIPQSINIEYREGNVILRTPILSEDSYTTQNFNSQVNKIVGYITVELDLSALRLQQYQEILAALIVLFLGLGLSGIFAYHLMRDVTRPISHMVSVVDRIRRGHLNVRIENQLHGELNTLKNGINAMAVSLSEYHLEMQQSIDQATSDLRATLERLEIQNIELDIAKKHAQEAARVKSEFLANMSHELRTPLNGVLGFTRQILKTSLSGSQEDYLQTIERSANNLLNIINDILDFSKLEAKKLLLEAIPFQFQDNLDETVELLAPSAHEKGLEITLDIDPQIPSELIGDPLRIQQILNNLIGNAIKFTEKGNIDISVQLKSQSSENTEILFIIQDSGIGISERQQTQLFQAFSQADASISRRHGGTGLGLVITQKLIEEMGGEIGLSSQLHQGSTFWFSIKLTSVELPVLIENKMRASTPITQHQQLAGKSLLMIEDNQKSASILQHQLSRFGLTTTHKSTLPNTINSDYDYSLISINSINQIHVEQLEANINLLSSHSKAIIVALPSTEIVLTERINQYPQVICISKPFTRKKFIDIFSLNNRVKRKAIATNETVMPKYDKLPITVMAVDDNPANLKLISVLLQEQVEHVVTSNNGIDAVEKAKQQHFDIILMDIQMPKMDGVTACKEIKKTGLNAQTPIIAVTAHAMKGERERLINEGMNDYLAKPIEEHMLQETITQWTTKAKQNPTLTSITTQTIEKAPMKKIAQSSSINWDVALEKAAGKTTLAQEMLDMLAQFIPEVDKTINQALNGEIDSERLYHSIHKLHGSCAYSGVLRLQQLCHIIESELKQKHPITMIEPELFELQDEMSKVVMESKRFL